MHKILTGKKFAMYIIVIQVEILWYVKAASVKDPMSVHILEMMALLKKTYHTALFGNLL
jgi:hypothetical protein